MHNSGEQVTTRWHRFSLTDIAVFIAGLGVCFAAHARGSANWWDACLVAGIVWISIGLLVQTYDLWSEFDRKPAASRDVRCAIRFAMFWRYAAVAVLVWWVVDSWFLIRDPEKLDAWTYPSVVSMLMIGESLGLLVLIGVLAAQIARPLAVRHKRLWIEKIASPLGLAAGLLILVRVATEQTLYSFYDYLAVVGIELSEGIHFYEAGAYAGIDPDLMRRQARLFWPTALATIVVCLNVVCCMFLARQWRLGMQRRTACGLLLALGLACEVYYFWWLYGIGLHELSPPHAEAIVYPPLHDWLVPAVMTMTFTTMASYRLVARRRTEHSNTLSWRRREAPYYHERALVVAIVAFLPAGETVTEFVSSATTYDLDIALNVYFTEPILYLQLAIVLLAGQLLVARACKRRLPDQIRPLNGFQFAAVWIAVFLATVTGIVTMAWFSLGLWLTPWHRLPL